MPRYVMIKHYRGTPPTVNDHPMDEWSTAEVEDHLRYMNDFADRLRAGGEFVDSQALAAESIFVRAAPDGSGPDTTPVPADNSLVAGWMMIDVASHERALELAAELSAEPGKGGDPIHEWLELRPVLGDH